MDSPKTEPQAGGGAPQADQKAAGEIDPRKLADKVYRLMLADLRLERARGVYPSRRKE